MKETVSSIFRQREVEKIYQIASIKEKYCFRTTFTMQAVDNTDNVISDKEIGRYDIEFPMLKVGDEFFLQDIEQLIKIKSKMRSSDGSILYYVEDKLVETQNTRDSLEICISEITNYNQQADELKEELLSVKQKFNEYKEKYKYKHRFFNKKQPEIEQREENY